jgi:aldehyde dehydrogenase (NAD+)
MEHARPKSSFSVHTSASQPPAFINSNSPFTMSSLLEAEIPTTSFESLDQQFIDGQWRAGRAGSRDDLDPFSGEVIATMTQGNRADLDDAYASAARAQPGWAALPPGGRAQVMRRVAAVMETHRDEIIGWLIREAGSTRIKASLEWQSVYSVALEAASLPFLAEGKILPSEIPDKECRVYTQPVGVVGVISPWNWPFQLSARSVFPALAVGNAVVLKPASDTPVTGGTLFGRIFEQAGLPAGVLSVVVGPGSEIGDAFVTHRTPRVISFTGSTPVGRGIMRLCADSPILKRTELELGGNSPFVVLHDADLDATAEAAVFGKFLHQGQICMIANRFIVEDAVYDDFLERFTDRVRQLKVGNPDEPDTMIGPIINQSQFDGLVEKIAHARKTGLREILGGNPEGRVLPPHIFADVPNDHDLAREEIFGPIAPIIRARDEADALRLANATDYGLSSCVFTRDVDRGVRFARKIEAGMTHVNDQPVNDLPFNPFGGEKNSGIGRFNGRWAVQAFTTEHWVTIQHAPRDYPRDANVLAGPWGGG